MVGLYDFFSSKCSIESFIVRCTWLIDMVFLQDAEAYTNLLNVLAPEHKSPSKLAAKNPFERAKNVLEHADRMGCRRYLTAKDIVEGSPNLNLAFVAHIFQHR